MEPAGHKDRRLAILVDIDAWSRVWIKHMSDRESLLIVGKHIELCMREYESIVGTIQYSLRAVWRAGLLSHCMDTFCAMVSSMYIHVSAGTTSFNPAILLY